MSIKLNRVMKKVLSSGFFRNDGKKRKGELSHEDAVAKMFSDCGFKVEEWSIPKAYMDLWMNKGDVSLIKDSLAEIDPGTVIPQPCGTCYFPDFLVKDFNGKLIVVECKSMRDSGTPIWNCGGIKPHPFVIYVVTCGKYMETTFFLGSDIITKELYALSKDVDRELRKVICKSKRAFEVLDKFKRGIGKRFRGYTIQEGPMHIADCFMHPDRKKCERRVIEMTKK